MLHLFSNIYCINISSDKKIKEEIYMYSISIIIPVYNVEKYLGKCLRSLCCQDYDNFEIIVVDDGSTDNSGLICDEYTKKYNNVRVLHKKNGGLSSARNYGIERARGMYVCLVDGDDYVQGSFVSKMVAAAREKNADVVVCGFDNEKPGNRVMTGEAAAIRLLLNQDNMEIIACNKMYKRVLFNEIKYPNGEKYEDNLTTYKLLSKARIVAYINELLYIYVKRIDSITNSDEKENRLFAREKAAMEATKFFIGQEKLYKAARVSEFTAKLAFIDSAVDGKIDKKYLPLCLEWIRKNKRDLLMNSCMSLKLRLYLFMTTYFGGRIYILFRKRYHE